MTIFPGPRLSALAPRSEDPKGEMFGNATQAGVDIPRYLSKGLVGLGSNSEVM